MVKVDKIKITRKVNSPKDSFEDEVIFTGEVGVHCTQIVKKEMLANHPEADSHIRSDIQKGILKFIYGDLYHQVYRIKRIALQTNRFEDKIELENRFKELEASISMCEETFKP